MTKIITLTSPDNNSKVKIEDGELVSYQKFGVEFMHPKNDPGWKNTDTEMFPIIGPTQKNNFKVSTPKGDCIQDQHGLLRNLDYIVLNSDNKTAIFQKDYLKNTQINNPKYPKSTEKEVFWTYDFRFIKKYELDNDALKIQFEIISEKGMPFMLGYHPAFNTTKKSYCKIGGQKVTIDDILKIGSDAYPLFNQNKLTLFNENRGIEITTEGFHNFMLWTEVENMVCIEPITQYPTHKTQKYSEKNMSLSDGNEKFSVLLKPFQI